MISFLRGIVAATLTYVFALPIEVVMAQIIRVDTLLK